jgi:hypothetical protein
MILHFERILVNRANGCVIVWVIGLSESDELDGFARRDAKLIFRVNSESILSTSFIFKLKIFEKVLLAAKKLCECQDYAIQTVPRTFIPKVVFIPGLKQFFARLPELRQKFKYDGLSILVVDAQSNHVPPGLTTLCGARNAIVIRLVAQPFDICVFGLFKIFCRRIRQRKRIKGETRKCYRELLAF